MIEFKLRGRASSTPRGHAQKTPLKGLRFESLGSLEEARAYLDSWEERWADTHIHGTTKRQVAGSGRKSYQFRYPNARLFGTPPEAASNDPPLSQSI